MGKRLLLYLRSDDMADRLAPEVLGQDWEVHVCSHPERASELGQDRRFHVGLVGVDGAETLSIGQVEELLLATPHMRWVALTSPEALASCPWREVIHQSFFDFHTLPANAERLRMALGHAYGMAALGGSEDGPGGELGMIGASAAMQEVYRAIHKAAGVSAPVLIQGESGTGKELVALAVHQNSVRADHPFVAVNCGALPANLIQSELFGHERGAFTGAHQRKIGRIEAASSGTIFLDEIGDLPLDMQVNLLRFLQDRHIERLGSTESISVDVRVVAASHVDLQEAVRQGRFREDLFYRLNVLRLEVPPLRERDGDVALLARHFFNEFRSESDPRIRGFSHGALQAMAVHAWPGNVRELMNRVRHAMVMSEHRAITAQDLGLTRTNCVRADQTLDQARGEAEKNLVENTLERARHNISEAARQLGVSRVTLYRLMEKYGLRA